MARVSAIKALVDGVRAYFVEEGYGEIVVYGAAKLSQQLDQLPAPARAGRVVIVSHDEQGKAGKVVPAREPGGRPRQIYGVDHLVEFHCWGRDVLAPRSDELAHYEVAYTLLEQAMSGARDIFGGRLVAGDQRQLVELKEARFGVGIVQQIVIHGALLEPDAVRVDPPIPPELSDNAMVFPSGDVAD
jgi:hypothetical protein